MQLSLFPIKSLFIRESSLLKLMSENTIWQGLVTCFEFPFTCFTFCCSYTFKEPQMDHWFVLNSVYSVWLSWDTFSLVYHVHYFWSFTWAPLMQITSAVTPEISCSLACKEFMQPSLLHMGRSRSVHRDVSPPGALQGWRWKSFKISAAFVVVGSPLSSLPWPLRLPPSPADPPASLRSGIREKTLLQLCSSRALPPPLKGLSLISMPLGLLGLLLPNKHSQDLLPCLPHSLFLWSPLAISLPSISSFLTSCFSLSSLVSLPFIGSLASS